MNRDYILANYDEYEIFKLFFREDLRLGRAYSCPWREDKNPSFVCFAPSRSLRGNRVLFKDHGTGEVGDCFDLVMKIEKCDFRTAIKIIDERLKLRGRNIFLSPPPFQKEEGVKNNKVHPKWMDWSNKAQRYWDEFGITLPTLNYFNVKPVGELRIGNWQLKYNNESPIYGYEFKDYLRKSKKGYKIYRPLADKKEKFFRDYSSAVTEGFEQALSRKAKICFISKSMKDAMCLWEMGFSAIAVPSESSFIPLDKLQKLWENFKFVIVFFDNDEAGINNGLAISKKYGLRVIFIPESEGAKDISDYIKARSMDAGKTLIKNLLL